MAIHADFDSIFCSLHLLLYSMDTCSHSFTHHHSFPHAQTEEQVTAVAAKDDFADDEVEAIMAGERKESFFD